MSEKQFITELMQIGYTEEAAEEIYDYYLSIDCIDNLNIIALLQILSAKLQEGHA